MKPRNIFVAFLLAIVITGSFQAQDSKKLNLDLFLDWEYVINPQISRTARKSYYTRLWADKINDKYENEVSVVNTDGSRNRFLFNGSLPVWSPDGKRLVYIAPGQPSGTQIFVK